MQDQKIIDNKPYNILAEIYDHIMKSVNYRNWAIYIVDILDEWDSQYKSCLEIGAGTGKLSKFLQTKFTNYYMLDLSSEMLKKIKPSYGFRICADMNYLPLKNAFNAIVSSFDTINYILDKEKLFQFFKNINSLLNKGSIFTFDVSLEANSIKNIDSLNRSGKFKGYKFKQISQFDKNSKFHINTFEIEDKKGNKFLEKHIQRVYDFYDYFNIIESAGLRIEACLDEFSFEDASPDSERAQFVIKGK